MADLNGVAGDFRAECAQQLFSERSGRNARRGFAGGSALQNVARIVKIEFLRTGEIGVAGTRRDEFFCGCIVFRIGFDWRESFPS